MENFEKTLEPILGNLEEIILNIDEESIKVYEFLKTEFSKGDILENHIFQFCFRSFYGLDSAGLTEDFKNHYFKLLVNITPNDTILDDLKKIVNELYEIKNLKGSSSLQISFATKLLHTVDNSFPIYDSKVVALMGFKNPPHYLTKDVRLEKFVAQIEELRAFYNILSNQENVIKKFDERFKTVISKEKKLDFILWSAGKLKSKKLKIN